MHAFWPGPFAPPFVGNLPHFIKYGTQNYLDMCRQKYGKVFKASLLCGSRPS
jgi:hypothetical protein